MAQSQSLPEDPDLHPDLQALNTNVPHPARVYDYWLGGKDNFAADREAAEAVIAANPNVLPGVRANRAFLGRAVRYLTGEAGIRQFLDLGTGSRPRRTPIRSPRPSHRTPGLSTSTTTRWCSPTPGRC